MANSEEKKLNPQQKQAVEHGRGPLLIIAGAGTGKTTVVTERIKHLVSSKLAKPEEILALTFTDKAAREMEERVDVAMPLGYTQMWISTFHSFCDRVLRQEALQIGLDPGYHLMGQAETTQLLRGNFFKFKLDYFRPLGNPNKFVEGMLQHFSRLKDEDVSAEDYLKYAQKLKNKRTKKLKKEEKEEAAKTLELANAYRTYEELKVKEGVMDFADLISNTLKLFRTRKNVLKRYQEQFKYILVDEFQDTNYAQNELAALLAGKKANLTVTGDDDQSVYRFRGAAVSNIIQFRKNYPKAKIVVLTKNYRSTQEILDRAYRLIQNNNPDRLEVKEKVNKKLTAVRKITGEPVEFIWTDRVENEAEAVAQKISELTSKGEGSYQFGDIAILVRANNHADAFVRALSRAGIPYQFLGPGQLFRQEEVKDLIAYLGLLDNFEDSAAAFRVLAMDQFGISARDLAAMNNYARWHHLSLFEAAEKVDKIKVSAKTRAHVAAFVKMVHRHLKLIRKETAGQILYYFLQDSGLLTKITQYQTPTQERRAHNIARFFDKLKTYEVEHEDATVPAVVDWIMLSLELGESPLATDIDWSEENRVNLLTAHSAKGLEFPVVFLVNLVAGRFPTIQRREQIPIPDALIKEILPVGDYHLEEERRLFYVGMTRARDRLLLSAANYYGEGKRERKVSPFVAEALGDQAIRKPGDQAREKAQLTLADWVKKEEPEVAAAKKPLDYLTYSMISTFQVCPLHFKLKYILGLPTPPSAALSFGSSIHSALHEFYRARKLGQKPGEKELLSMLERSWVSEGFNNRRHEELTYKKGQKFMRSFWRQVKGEKTSPLALEQPFNFKLGDLKVGGKIDRVDPTHDGGIRIIDYKTGAGVLEQNQVDRDLQLTIYALAATQVPHEPFGRKADEVLLSLWYLEPGEQLVTKRSQRQLGEAKKELVDWAEKIAQSDYACSGSQLCRDCEYKLFCQPWL